jgi:hypothetical protein
LGRPTARSAGTWRQPRAGTPFIDERFFAAPGVVVRVTRNPLESSRRSVRQRARKSADWPWDWPAEAITPAKRIYCTGLENRRPGSPARGFESRPRRSIRPLSARLQRFSWEDSRRDRKSRRPPTSARGRVGWRTAAGGTQRLGSTAHLPATAYVLFQEALSPQQPRLNARWKGFASLELLDEYDESPITSRSRGEENNRRCILDNPGWLSPVGRLSMGS